MVEIFLLSWYLAGLCGSILLLYIHKASRLQAYREYSWYTDQLKNFSWGLTPGNIFFLMAMSFLGPIALFIAILGFLVEMKAVLNAFDQNTSKKFDKWLHTPIGKKEI